MPHQDCEQLLAAAIECFQSGDMERMRALCTKAAQADQNNPEAKFMLGMSEFGLGNFSRCIEHVGEAIALAPEQADYYELIARAYTLGGQNGNAAEMIRKAISLDPDNPAMHCLKATIHQEIGEINDARASYCYALSLDQDYVAAKEGNALICIALSNQALDENDVAAAKRNQNELSGWLPDYMDKICGEDAITLARALINLDRGDEGEELLSRFMGDAPENIDVNGESLLQKIFQIEKDYAATYISAAKVLRMKGLFEAAARACEHCLELGREEAGLYLLYGKLLLDLGRHDEASEIIRKGERKFEAFARVEFDFMFKVISFLEEECSTVEIKPGKRIDPRSISRVVVIVFYGRSGTAFMSSLLDFHPDVLSIHTELREFFIFFWKDCEKLDNAYEQFCFFLNHYNSATGETFFPLADPAVHGQGDGEPWPPGGVCRHHFVTAFLNGVEAFFGSPKTCKLSRKQMFTLLHTAFAEASGRTIESEAPIIVYHQHVWNEDWGRQIVNDFSDATFLHMIRKPLQSLGSHFIRYRSQLDFPAAFMACHVFEMLFKYDAPMVDGYRHETVAVRLEDVHFDPEKTLKTLAERLGLAWSESMMQSTANGKPFAFTSGEKKLTGFDPNNVKDKHSGLYFLTDKIFFYGVLRRNYEIWGYPTPWYGRVRWPKAFLKLLAFLPFNMEVRSWLARGAFKKGALCEIAQAYLKCREIKLNRLENLSERESRIIDHIL